VEAGHGNRYGPFLMASGRVVGSQQWSWRRPCLHDAGDFVGSWCLPVLGSRPEV
jgi:hypothetical protein